MLNRDPYVRLWRELSSEKSMVFLTGPRQCGKTTLAKLIGESHTNCLYFNWAKRLDNNGYPLLVASAARWFPNLP